MGFFFTYVRWLFNLKIATLKVSSLRLVTVRLLDYITIIRRQFLDARPPKEGGAGEDVLLCMGRVGI